MAIVMKFLSVTIFGLASALKVVIFRKVRLATGLPAGIKMAANAQEDWFAPVPMRAAPPTAAVAARRNSFEGRAIAPPVAHASTPTSIPKTTAMHAFQRKNTATQLPLIVAVLINAVSLGRFAFEKVTVRRKRRKETESNLGKNAAIQGNAQTATFVPATTNAAGPVLKIQIVPTNSFAPLMRAIKSPHVRRAHNVPAPRTNRRSFNGLLRVTSAKRTASVPNSSGRRSL
tara:strand:- start:50 stop:739 length:690 start_codon:yes stop_codon:yes gene_type:complete